MLFAICVEGRQYSMLEYENETAIPEETDRVFIFTWYNKDVMYGLMSVTIRDSLLPVYYFYMAHRS